MILALRTDEPESEIGLYVNGEEVAYLKWYAHRQLAETIHQKLQDTLDSRGKKWADVAGVVVYRGPGSFTGLRIGMSVANALAYSLGVPVVGASGDNWLIDGFAALQAGRGNASAVPEYGSAANVTKPKK